MPNYPITLRLPEGTIEAELPLPDGPVRLIDLTAQLVGLSSAVAEMGERAAERQGARVSCTKGCGACCRQIVPLAPFEAAMIAELVESLPEARRAQIERRFADARERLARADLLATLEDPDGELPAGVEQRYFAEQIACPFLEDESCSIHPLRPSRCREYLVTSPPEGCADPHQRPVARLPVTMRLSEALSMLWASASQGSAARVPFVLALDWTRAHPQVRHMGGDPARLLPVLCRMLEDIAGRIEREELAD